MNDWVTKPLGALVKFQKGRKVATSRHPQIGYDSYLGAGALSGRIDEYASTFLAVPANTEDVLMLWDGERSGLVSTGLSGVVSSTVCKLSPQGSVSGEYLYYSLSNSFEWIQNRRTGTGVPHVPKDIGRILQVTFPSKRTAQLRIVEILQTIDQAIEHTSTLIEKYQQIKAGLMHDLFTRGIGANGKLRPPREQAPDLYQETPIGWIPKEWECMKLKHKAKDGTPHLRTGPFGSSLKGEHWVTEGVPVITIGALGEGEFYVDQLLYISDITATRLADFKMSLGDVVFSRVADVGRSVAIEENQVGWVMSSNLMRISLDKGLVDSQYLQQELSFDRRIKAQIRCKVNSGGRDVANSEVLNSLWFAFPCLNEQREIVRRSSTIDEVICSNRTALDMLGKKKAGLMHDLLTGKVQVTPDPEAPHG